MPKLFRFICFVLVLLLLPLCVLAAEEEAECAHIVSAWEKVDGDTHTAVCTLCGSTVSKSHEYSDFWKVTATEHSRECYLCGHTAEAAAHSWPDSWEGDEVNHVRLCTVCQVGGESQDHIFGKAELVKWPLLFRTGRREQTCTICGYLHAVAVPPLKTLRIVLFCLLGAALLTTATVFTVRFIKKKQSKKESSRS